LRDARLPITKTATRCREYLGELERRGARFVQPGVEALAALEALRKLICDARSGDLSVRGEAIGEADVCAWLAGRLDGELSELLDRIETPSSEAEVDLKRDLRELLAREYVIGLDAAARELAVEGHRLQAVAESDPTQFGLLQGPPAVLYAYAVDES
jgi:hypothetical protein